MTGAGPPFGVRPGVRPGVRSAGEALMMAEYDYWEEEKEELRTLGTREPLKGNDGVLG